jgi:hypothetical protein
VADPAVNTSLPVLVVFLGGMGGSPIEELLAEALRAAALDSLDEALATGAFGGAVLATDCADLRARTPAGATVDLDAGPFHFGRRLLEIIQRYEIERALYFGGGSVPLLRGSDFAAIARHLQDATGVVISNNFYSADLVAFAPGSALARLEPPTTDNVLPRLLKERAGLESRPLPRTCATQFNIDSPGDLAILRLSGGAGPRLTRLLDSLPLHIELYRRATAYLTDPSAEVLVAGRVGSQVWQYLERETACRVRLFSEERGMEAAGRHQAGRARSLLGFHLQQVGLSRFFQEMSEMADAAFIDTRVLAAHQGARPSRADRFLSDMGRHKEIADPFLRELTDAAGRAPIPVVLGGHSLVAGGLMALTEAAWRDHDRALGRQ